MKNALISPEQQAKYISSWSTELVPPMPIYTILGQRVAQVSDITFEVGEPLHWVICEDTIIADDYGYVPSTQEFVLIPPNVPKPV